MFSERKKRKKIVRLSYSQTPCWHSHLEAAQIWSHIYSPCCRFSNWYYTHPSVMKSMSRISMKAPCCGLWAVFSRGKRLWPYVHIKVTPCRTLLEIRRLKTHSSLNAFKCTLDACEAKTPILQQALQSLTFHPRLLTVWKWVVRKVLLSLSCTTWKNKVTRS